MSALRVGLRVQPVEMIQEYLKSNQDKLSHYSNGDNISLLISDLPPISKGLSANILVDLARAARKIASTKTQEVQVKKVIFEKLDVLSENKKEAFYQKVRPNN